MYTPTLYDAKFSPITDVRSLVSEINRYLVSDYSFLTNTHIVSPFSDHRRNKIASIVLTGLSTTEENIPNFFSPLYNPKRNWIAIDLRNFVSADKAERTFRLKNSIEGQLNLHRMILNGLWLTKELSSIYSLRFAEDVYANWFSETLVRRYGLTFGLTAGEGLTLKALAYFYYMRMFKEKPLTEDDKEKLKIRHKNQYALPPEVIEEVYSVIKDRKFDDVEDFCEACYATTDNVRLKGFSYGTLLTMVTTHWFGQIPSRELMMGVLQHPPTWIAMIYFALKMKSYKNTYIAMSANKLDKKGKGDQFIKEYEALVLPHLDLDP